MFYKKEAVFQPLLVSVDLHYTHKKNTENRILKP